VLNNAVKSHLLNGIGAGRRKTRAAVLLGVTATVVGTGLFASPALADTPTNTAGISSSTTLDACGYFVGTQTPKRSYTYVSGGVKHHVETGTWTGVDNNYSLTPVASLGSVKGSYSEVASTDASGNVNGIEAFQSNAGSISQQFAFTPASGYTVSVKATRNLSFLTCDTKGHCYTGPIPRP